MIWKEKRKFIALLRFSFVFIFVHTYDVCRLDASGCFVSGFCCNDNLIEVMGKNMVKTKRTKDLSIKIKKENKKPTKVMLLLIQSGEYLVR